jgi:GAF domain-containing protein
MSESQLAVGAGKDHHPPMRGWLAVPLIGFDGQNYGFIQASDRLEGEFTEQDEANLVRLAILTSAALDGLAQLHLPDYQDKVGT